MVVKRVGSCQEHTWVIKQRVGSCAWLTLSLHATWLVLRAVFPWSRPLPFLNKSKFLGSLGPNKCWDPPAEMLIFLPLVKSAANIFLSPYLHPSLTPPVHRTDPALLKGYPEGMYKLSSLAKQKTVSVLPRNNCPCCSPLGYEYHKCLWSWAQRNYLI